MNKLEFELVPRQDFYGKAFRIGREETWKDEETGKTVYGHLVARIEFVPIPHGVRLPDDCWLGMSGDELMDLADVLWKEGIRPHEFVEGVDPELHEATKSHLDDLRSILKMDGK